LDQALAPHIHIVFLEIADKSNEKAPLADLRGISLALRGALSPWPSCLAALGRELRKNSSGRSRNR